MGARSAWSGFLVGAVVTAALAFAWLLRPETLSAPRGSLALFVAAAALGEMITVDKLRGHAIPVASAVVATFALLGNPPGATAAVAAGGWVLAAVVRAGAGSELRPLDLLGRVSIGVSLPGVVALAALLAPAVTVATAGAATEAVNVVGLAAVSLVLVVGVPYWEAIEETVGKRVRILPVYRGLFLSSSAALVAFAASAGLAAMVHGALGAWAIVLMLLPLLAARSGLRRHALVQRTYDQTVRAMSRLPELVGATTEGHGIRVGRLAMEIGRELALADEDVAALERAAHLHELGAVRDQDAGANVATAGAAVVREAGNMPAVVAILERQRDPYRRRREGEDASVPMTARILRTACDYDEYSHPGGPGRQPWDALERLHLGMAYDHDPVVIQALSRVLSRRGVL